MTTTLILLKYVDRSLELLVRLDHTYLCKNLSSLDLLLVDTAEEETYVVTSLTLIEELTEHLNTCYDSLLRLLTETYDLNLVTNGDPTWEAKVMELMAAVDEYIPLPPRDIDKPFLMPIEDIFSITGRGTVATGRIETGVIHVGDEVEIVGLGDEPKKTVVTGVEMFRKLLDQGEAGDNVGLLLRGIDKKEIKRGQVLAKVGMIKPYQKFEASIYVLKKDEGGRHTPFHNHYRPQFFIRTLDITGEITLPEGVEMVMPGDNVAITVDLIYPVAINEGLQFAIREGGRTVGAGQVTKLID